MSYQVLALKYRPQTFDEVVGQSHVTTTLANAIVAQRVAHAILFTGPRGTGKTTIARILAKAMNCKTGPTVTPCNQCKICTDIIEGHCTDVFEIDGASNNSVDQIRDLRENVTYLPASATHKIYIIDEVHMLSTAAFNALLKTLEEPPEHVMFIFATTEVHKIPATILSRCQRHDLGRIKLESIASHLEKLGIKEGFQIEPQSLDLIAQQADGSVRDSLSLFDRILSAAPNESISHEQVLSILGVFDRRVLLDISKAIFEKDGMAIVNLIDTVDNWGLDLKKFYSDIILHFRHLNIIKLCGVETPAVSIAASEKKMFNDLVSKYSAGFLNDILQVMLNEESLIRYSSHTKICIETVLLKLLDINPGTHIDQIIQNLDLLGSQIKDKFPDGPYPSKSNPNSVKSREPQTRDARYQDYPQSGQPAPCDPPSSESPPLPPADVPHDNSWQGFLSKIQQTHPFVFALISKGEIKKTDTKILVQLKNCSAFDKQRLEGKKEQLQSLCREILQKDLDIKIISQNNSFKTEEKKDKIKAQQAAFNHPLVVEAQKMFDGKIINY